jgi:hypothetical protein
MKNFRFPSAYVLAAREREAVDVEGNLFTLSTRPTASYYSKNNLNPG